MRLLALSAMSSCQTLGTRASALCALAVGSGSPRRRTPASCGISAAAWLDDLVADLAEIERALIQAPLAIVGDPQIAGRGGAEIVAARQPGILELEPQVDREAGRRGESDRAAAVDRAVAGAAGEAARCAAASAPNRPSMARLVTRVP